jgi:hypothetical protein
MKAVHHTERDMGPNMVSAKNGGATSVAGPVPLHFLCTFHVYVCS